MVSRAKCPLVYVQVCFLADFVAVVVVVVVPAAAAAAVVVVVDG